MTGGPAPALNHTLARMQRLLIESPFAGPAPGKVVEGIVSRRERPGRCGRFFHPNGLRLTVFNRGRTRQDPALGVDGVVQRHKDVPLDVFEHDVDAVLRYFVAIVMQH